MAQGTTRAEPRTDSELATAALRFARRVHLGQYRKQTHEQFVEHPIAVARLLSEAGFEGPIMAAAYLHDVVEKTPVQLDELRERFGPEVAMIVDSLSEDIAIDGYGPRKRALRQRVLDGDRTPIIIYAADRVINMRDWRRVPPEDREAVGARLDTTLDERLQLWREDLEELTAYDPDLPFLAEIEIEMRGLLSEAQAIS
jgi:GTP diphosphokinase / guanosine-3',5'-bis(diphosphate) 3'-diphosphatase